MASMKRLVLRSALAVALIGVSACGGESDETGDAFGIIGTAAPTETTAPPTTTPATTVPPTPKPAQRPRLAASPNQIPIEAIEVVEEPVEVAGGGSGQSGAVDYNRGGVYYDPGALASEVGWIQIPAIGLNATAWKAYDDNDAGATNAALDRGPSFWGNVTMPGQQGNLVVGGHRTSKGAWFRHIDELQAGDQIVTAGPDGVPYTYLVTEVGVLSPNDTWILNDREGATITLFACHPPGSVRQRIVVFGELAA